MDFDEIYAGVEEAQREQLRKFRAGYPPRALTTLGFSWEYIMGGEGEQTLVLLPGGARFAETWFGLMDSLAHRYRLLAVSWPPATKMGVLVEGLRTILEAEGVDTCTLLGASFGGFVAQCYVRHYPQQVARLILSNTTTPQAYRSRTMALAVQLARLLPAGMLRRSLARNTLALMTLNPGNRPFWEAYWQEQVQTRLAAMGRSELVALNLAALDYTRSYQFAAGDLQAWTGKVMIVESNDDPAIDGAARAALRAVYPQAAVYTLMDGGHTPGYSDPEAFRSLVVGFLEGGAAAG